MRRIGGLALALIAGCSNAAPVDAAAIVRTCDEAAVAARRVGCTNDCVTTIACDSALGTCDVSMGACPGVTAFCTGGQLEIYVSGIACHDGGAMDASASDANSGPDA
jgi:hypothetical protein